MNNESVLSGERALFSLIKRCSGKIYINGIDKKISKYTNEDTLNTLLSLSQYNHITDDNLQEKAENLSTQQNKEPVKYLKYNIKIDSRTKRY